MRLLLSITHSLGVLTPILSILTAAVDKHVKNGGRDRRRDDVPVSDYLV